MTVAQIVPMPREYGDARTAPPEGICVHLACEKGMEATHSIAFHFGQEHTIKMPGFKMLAFAFIWGMMENHVHTILSQLSYS
jgi:hypothetical protein